MADCVHKIRPATVAEGKHDCCGDRYERNIAFVCACGKQGCRTCIERHLMDIHAGKVKDV